MKLSEYVEKKDFDFGLPQGDTIIDLPTTDVEETIFKTKEGEEKPSWKLTTATGDAYAVPKTVMAAIKSEQAKGTKKVRVTRTGTMLATRYTVIAVKE